MDRERLKVIGLEVAPLALAAAAVWYPLTLDVNEDVPYQTSILIYEVMAAVALALAAGAWALGLRFSDRFRTATVWAPGLALTGIVCAWSGFGDDPPILLGLAAAVAVGTSWRGGFAFLVVSIVAAFAVMEPVLDAFVDGDRVEPVVAGCAFAAAGLVCVLASLHWLGPRPLVVVSIGGAVVLVVPFVLIAMEELVLATALPIALSFASILRPRPIIETATSLAGTAALLIATLIGLDGGSSALAYIGVGLGLITVGAAAGARRIYVPGILMLGVLVFWAMVFPLGLDSFF